jgi:hypothetical protein
MNVNMDEYRKLNAGEQSLVDWQLRRGLGGFESALWGAICRADTGNLARLEVGFTQHVAAYRKYSHEAGWWRRLKRRLTKEVTA